MVVGFKMASKHCESGWVMLVVPGPPSSRTLTSQRTVYRCGALKSINRAPGRVDDIPDGSKIRLDYCWPSPHFHVGAFNAIKVNRSMFVLKLHCTSSNNSSVLLRF